MPPERVLGFLGDLPLGVLRGVGSKTLPKLQRLGLRTVADLRALSLEQLQVHLGARAALSLYQQARGIASDQVGEGAQRQSLSKETTFPQDVSDPRHLQDTLGVLAEEVAQRARREGIAGQTVTLKIRFRGFVTHTRQRCLPQPSDDARTLQAAAWSLYQQGRWPDKPVRLIGLGISELGPPPPIQADPSTRGPERGSDSAEERRLNETLDRIKEGFGTGAVRRGSRHPPRVTFVGELAQWQEALLACDMLLVPRVAGRWRSPVLQAMAHGRTILAPADTGEDYLTDGETACLFRPGDIDSFALSSASGDEVYLSAAAGGLLTGYRRVVSFGPAANGVSFGRHVTSAVDGRREEFVPMAFRTFGVDNPDTVDDFRAGAGLPNSGPRIGPVVITEIMYHPPDLGGTNDNVRDEFIELRNLTLNPDISPADVQALKLRARLGLPAE